jgi:ABC-type glycerol-3-phosphate transport system substrate-binding protein
MQRLTLAALAACALLAGCATGDAATKSEYADASYTPVGTYIPKKAPSRMDNVVIVDKTSLENGRDNGSLTNNAPNKNY